MVAGSILPVTIHKNKLYFLFGKENSMEDSAKGFSDFGGGLEGNETPYQTALREGSEELTGFLGNSKELEKRIKQGGGVYKISHNDYHVHMFFLPYDENLPKYYNDNHRFLWDKMNNKTLNDSKLFEKIEICWFSLNDMKQRLNEFRGFYQEIVEKFILEKENIHKFIESKYKKRRYSIRKTRKNKKN
jgi:8-oxo-dGTP pyrophosphatase MutT (NUDIX family)